jgi:hypothetical protein
MSRRNMPSLMRINKMLKKTEVVDNHRITTLTPNPVTPDSDTPIYDQLVSEKRDPSRK